MGPAPRPWAAAHGDAGRSCYEPGSDPTRGHERPRSHDQGDFTRPQRSLSETRRPPLASLAATTRLATTHRVRSCRALWRELAALRVGRPLSAPRKRHLQGDQTAYRSELRQCILGASGREWMDSCVHTSRVWLKARPARAHGVLGWKYPGSCKVHGPAARVPHAGLPLGGCVGDWRAAPGEGARGRSGRATVGLEAERVRRATGGEDRDNDPEGPPERGDDGIELHPIVRPPDGREVIARGREPGSVAHVPRKGSRVGSVSRSGERCVSRRAAGRRHLQAVCRTHSVIAGSRPISPTPAVGRPRGSRRVHRAGRSDRNNGLRRLVAAGYASRTSCSSGRASSTAVRRPNRPDAGKDLPGRAFSRATASTARSPTTDTATRQHWQRGRPPHPRSAGASASECVTLSGPVC
jgi:hypothetical protein